MTANTSLHKGRDPRYLTEGAGAGHAGGTRYYTEAAGEPPGQWAGRAAATLGLAGDVDADQLQALYMDRVGPDGERLDARARGQVPAGEGARGPGGGRASGGSPVGDGGGAGGGPGGRAGQVAASPPVF